MECGENCSIAEKLKKKRKETYLFFGLFFLLFLSFQSFAQTIPDCGSIEEIFKNSDFCDNKNVFVQGKVLGNSTNNEQSKYVSEFKVTDGQNVINVKSKDNIFLVDNDSVNISGIYYQNSASDYSDDVIAAAAKNINVIINAEDYTDLMINYVGRNMVENEDLQKRIMILYIIAPILILAAFYFGLHFLRRKGAAFENYVKSLFKKEEWDIDEDNSFRRLRRWVKSYNNPDFVFTHRITNKKVAIECKYKISLPNNKMDKFIWAYQDKIENYQKFSRQRNIPAFIVIGIAGSPKNPKRMFIIPLNQIKYPNVSMEYLEKFGRDPRKPFVMNNFGYPV